MSQDLPPTIPFGKFKEAAEVLGVAIRGVTKITIELDKVTVDAVLKDEQGHTVTSGQYTARLHAEIPLVRS